MSNKQNDILIENLIEKYNEVSSIIHSEEAPWMYSESDLEDIISDLEGFGINAEDLED